MKLTQNLIIFDLETTAHENEDGTQSNDNIIQIGAVYLRKSLTNYEIEDTFNALVKPKDEVISPFITELTGITNEMVKDRPYFDEVGPQFAEWASRGKNLKSTRLCAWGTYFDIPILRSHYVKNKIKYPFSGTAYDVKTWAALWMMLSGRRTDKLSVEAVMKAMAIRASGQYHNALFDAECTAKIALRIFNDLDKGFFVTSPEFSKTVHFKAFETR
jgi:DNA polymerase-3 subunit alpha (Gram-positive type)